MTHTAPPRRYPRLLTWCAAALVSGLVLAPGVPARAAPSPGDLEAQINAAQNQLEPVIEQYNLVHTQSQDTQAKIDAMQQQLAPLQAQVDAARDRVGLVSAQLYKTGPEALTLIQTASATAFTDQLTTLEQLAHERSAEVAAAVAQLDSYAEARRPLDALEAQLTAQQAELDAKRTTIQARIAQLQKSRPTPDAGSPPATGTLRPVRCPVENYGDRGSRAAVAACALIGRPYVWGAAGPRAYDCSGLTKAAWASVGVPLDHYTGSQWHQGVPVSRAELRPGDLVFWFPDLHHMGIYVGGGWVVNAPHTDDYVRMAPLDRGLPTAGYRRPG